MGTHQTPAGACTFLFHLHRHWLVVFSGKMRLLIILFLSTLSLWSVSEGRSVVFSRQNKDSYVELFPQHTMALKAFPLCMRFGSTVPIKDTILFEYRTSRRDELAIWRLKTGGYGVYVGGLDVPLLERPENHDG